MNASNLHNNLRGLTLAVTLLTVFLFFNSLAYSQASAWSVPLTIIGDGSSFTRTFGGDPGATEGYDAGLDKIAAPPFQIYYVYFKTTPPIEFLDTDIRAWISPYATDITWTLQVVNATGKTSKVTWDSSNLPPQGKFTLEGANGLVDMRTKSSVSFSGDKLISIRYQPTPAPTPAWSVLLNFTGNGSSFTRTFGGDPSATDGYDVGLDVLAAPPFQSYYVYFETAEPIEYLDTDIRAWISPYQTDITWTLQVVNAAGKTTKVTWEPSGLPSEGKFTLEGANGSVDMRTENSASFSGDKVFTIQYHPLVTKTWKVPLSIVGNGMSFTRTFGGDPTATEDFDKELDFVTAPPGMSYHTFFEITDFPYYLDKDIRGWLPPYDADITWTLQIINAMGITTTIKWDPANLPSEGNFFLKEANGPVDMRIQNSITFTGDRTLLIHYSGVEIVIQDSLIVNDATGPIGGTDQKVSISLTNSFPVSGIQFELHDIPDELELSTEQLSDRCEGFELSVTDHGSYVQLFLYHLGGKNIAPGNGPIVDLFYNVSSSAVNGSHVKLELKAVKVIDQNLEEKSVVLKPGVFTLSGLKGDVNGDGERDILDILLIISFINGSRAPTPEQKWAADCNDDGVINVLDIVQLINWINHPSMKKDVFAQSGTLPAQFILEPIHYSSETGGTIQIKMVTSQPIAAIQLKLSCEEAALAFQSPKLVNIPKAMEHSIHRSGDQLIILFYSLAGSSFEPGEHLLCELPVNVTGNFKGATPLKIDEIILSDEHVHEIPVQIQNKAFSTSEIIPKAYSLGPNYPNPFNPDTRLTYQLPDPSEVTIKIYNMLGQEIRMLVNKYQAIGRYEIEWDGTDKMNNAVVSGVYLAVMQAGKFKQVRKMLLMR